MTLRSDTGQCWSIRRACLFSLIQRGGEGSLVTPIQVTLERLEFRRLFNGAISGVVYADYDRDGLRDSGEPGLGNWQVYLDNNDNGRRDSGEQIVSTSGTGDYQFSNLPTGSHVIRQILPEGWEQTSPMASAPAPLAGLVETNRQAAAPDQILFASADRYPLRQLQSYLRTNLRGFGSAVDFESSSHLLRTNGETIVQLQFRAAVDVSSVMSELDEIPFITWTSPNYLYQPKTEYVPNDLLAATQYHHALVQNTTAWDITRGDPSVVIAVIDEGIDWNHPDLAQNIWTNTDEIPSNGIDDDQNGYIDDTRGWDVADNDNNPAPDSLSDSHGTHVAGIAAARVDNQVGIAGVAGRASIMAVRAIDHTKLFSSAYLATAYRYAADNGAKIVVSSYNTDDFANDPVYKAGLQYLYNEGALHFNSAGNGSFADPARQAFEQSILVGASDANDIRGDFSNFGWGIDLTAPGTSILSTIPENGYDYLSGTSMAAPMAAGVAALIWSAFPQYTREQVAARLMGLADPIDYNNIGFEGKLGSGRINAYRALTGNLPAPRFRADSILGLPANLGTTFSSPANFSVDIASVLEPSSVSNAANWQLRGDGADDEFGTSDDIALPLTLQTAYAVGTNRLKFTMPALEPDDYQLIGVSGTSAIRDPFGTPLDGDFNGTAGGNFVHAFTVLPSPAAARVTLGSQNITGIHFASVDRNPLRINSAAYKFLGEQAFTLTFSKSQVNSLVAGDLIVKNLTSGQVLNPDDFTTFSDANGKYQTVRIGGQNDVLADGRYLVTVSNAALRDAFGNAMPADYQFGFFAFGGDANRDSAVDSLDFNILSGYYGKRNEIFTHGDFNYDRVVDTSDFNILAGNWGETLGLASA